MRVIHSSKISEEASALRHYVSARLEAGNYDEDQAWALVVAMGALFEHIIAPLKPPDREAIRAYVKES